MELQNNGGYFLHQVIFASFAVLSVLCIMLLPESKRKPLPDSMKEGENQCRPPLFPARPYRDSLPLLCTRPPLSDYNPDNYSRLVSATRKMLSKDNLPYRTSVPAHPPLLSDNYMPGPENETLRETWLRLSSFLQNVPQHSGFHYHLIVDHQTFWYSFVTILSPCHCRGLTSCSWAVLFYALSYVDGILLICTFL